MTTRLTTARLLIAAAITATVTAATLTPVAASAQRHDTSRAELRRDRQDIREERREYRDARRAYREDRRDYRQERSHGRPHYAPHHGPRFAAPFRYRSFNVGATIGSAYWGPRYRISPQRSWGLPPAARQFTYVRHYDDLLLINVRTGRVARVYRNFY